VTCRVVPRMKRSRYLRIAPFGEWETKRSHLYWSNGQRNEGSARRSTPPSPSIGKAFLAAQLSVVRCFGYAPPGWTTLTEHLRGQRLTDDDILGAGLATTRASTGRVVDRLRDRLMLPIRSASEAIAD